MSADALFWAGLATAVSVGLALCLMALQKRRADLTAAQQMLTAQATEPSEELPGFDEGVVPEEILQATIAARDLPLGERM